MLFYLKTLYAIFKIHEGEIIRIYIAYAYTIDIGPYPKSLLIILRISN